MSSAPHHDDTPSGLQAAKPTEQPYWAITLRVIRIDGQMAVTWAMLESGVDGLNGSRRKSELLQVY